MRKSRGQTISVQAQDTPRSIMSARLVLLLVALALLLIGFVMVYSSSSILALNEGSSTESYFIKQVGFALVGGVGCLIAWKLIPYQAWRGPFLWIAWVVAIALVIMTALVGSVGLGAQRWLYIGPVGLQPSEFAKIVFLLMAAKILVDFQEEHISLKGALIQGFFLILIPLMFIYRAQSDLGTTLICFVGIFVVMWLGEVPLRVMLGILVAGIVFALAASTVGYRSDRFVFLNPWDDGEGGLGGGYQLIHSYYAFAEGGLFGVGLGNSREKFLYLPEAETDFIFAIIGEELGLIGALLVIVLFLLLLYSGLRISRLAPDAFGQLIAGGFTVMIVFQAFLNIGCVIGLLPTTGKPLPFISAGGSSLIASLCMLGLILSVSQAPSAPNLYDQRRADLRVVKVENSSSGRRSQAKGGSKRGTSGAQKSSRASSRQSKQSAQSRRKRK